MTAESTLYTPLSHYLEARGYRVGVGIHPRPGSPREYDVVGVKPRLREVATIEAKMGHFPRAFEQALLRQLVCDWVYVSFPLPFALGALTRHHPELISTGVGLLGVQNRRVKEILPAKRSTVVDSRRRETLIGMVTQRGDINE